MLRLDCLAVGFYALAMMMQAYREDTSIGGDLMARQPTRPWVLIAWLVCAIPSVVFLLCLGVNRPLSPPTQMRAIELDS